MKSGQIYYINFQGNKGLEINKIHLGIIYCIPKVSNLVFCIPLTSPKEKHFKTKIDYINRNHLELKYQNLVYIKETDSIALLDQIKTISIQRIIKKYSKELLDNTKKLLTTKLLKYMANILI